MMQVLSAHGQEHIQEAGFVYGGVGNAYVVPHELVDEKFSFEQARERQRIDFGWVQHREASRTY